MNAVIYARYSSDHQREESIEGQLRECKEYADRNDMVVIKTYIDRALSAKTDNRPEFQRMIKDSTKGLFDIVLVWKLDRFARNRYDSAHYKAMLRKNGVKVVSAKEAISEGPEGIILESMLEGYAEYYSAELAQKVTRGMTENALKGRFNGGAVTFGYYIDKEKHFKPDPVNAPIVKGIFTRYADGEPIRDILDSLEAQGVKNRYGKRPSYNFVTHILKNRRYLGEYCFKDTVVENAFEPLVSKEVFDKCRKRLSLNKHVSAHFKPVDDTYILTGKLFCGLCGSPMSGVSGTSKTGDIHRYYICRAAKSKKSCGLKRIKKEFVENIVLNCTLKLLDDSALIDRIAETCFKLQSAENTKIPAMNRRLKQIETELDNVMRAVKKGIISSTIQDTLNSLEQEKTDLEIEILKEQCERPILSKEQIKFWIYKFKRADIANNDQKRRLIDTFINSIYIYDDKILITYNCKDGERQIDFADAQNYFRAYKNSGSQSRRSSPILRIGDPSGSRRAYFAYRNIV